MARSRTSCFIFLMVIVLCANAKSFAQTVPERIVGLLDALNQSSWQSHEDGLDVMRVITQQGLVMTAYRISPNNFDFEVVLQDHKKGSRAEEIGEREGAVLAFNGGFFAETDAGMLYSIGYLRRNGEVLSKGWARSGGLVVFGDTHLELLPSHSGIPKNKFDILQSRPMIIEPGGKWAMHSNLGEIKHRTLLCKLPGGDMLLVAITRAGLSLYEAGWVLRSREEGGFFGCDSALALDGGRSTQIWYSGYPSFSYAGITPVHNFIVVRQRDN